LSRERSLLSGADAVLFGGRQHASVRYRECRCNPAWSETLACRYTLRPGTGRSPARPHELLAWGPHREGVEPKPMMYGPEKSDPCVVAMKSVNKLGRLGAESMERRRGAKGNVPVLNMCRTQSRESMPQQPARVRTGVQFIVRLLVNYPRWEPGA
jgi:hypothetical protein